MTLFGDAAHPIVPFLGQGGCMAIEDSYIFALLLNKLDMNIPMAQKIYSKLRIPRNNKIARMSLQQARLNHIENYYLASLRNMIMKKTNVISSRTNYIWEYDAHVQVERELKNYSFNKTTNI
jgi:2-polyprenyl-6-methoxyphenol hydroxylase-like FAD-dependent oxidoreductase